MGSIPVESVAAVPHIVCIPFPAQGHVNPFRNLAKLLHDRGFHITMVYTEFNHARLIKSKGREALKNYPGFRFETIPDGVPPSNPDATQSVTELLYYTKKHSVVPLRDLIVKLNSNPDLPPVNCIISDGIMAFGIKVARELGIPEVQFLTASTCGLVAYMQFEELVKRGIFPLKGAPPKRKRGVVVAKKTKDTFRLTGAKIKVEWDDVHNVLANKEIASQMSRDIGMKVKDNVPMVASVYGDLPKEAKGIVYSFITIFYGIDIEHNGQFNWIHEVAASRYKDWKHDCRRHWEKHREEVPLEFLKRPREWEWLCKEFSSDENKRLSQKMKAARVALTRMNHHSGTTVFVYRAQEHVLAGHAAPFVATFKDVYDKDKIGATHVESMERDVEEKLNELSEQHPDAEDQESLPLETQISVITTRIGEGKGTTYRGLGRSIRREPKKRGGVSRVDVDAMVEERVAERVNAVEEKVQEQLKKQEEQHQQQMKKQEEQLEDQMKEIVQQQLDAAVAQAIAKFMEAQQRQFQEGTPSNVNPSSDT